MSRGSAARVLLLATLLVPRTLSQSPSKTLVITDVTVIDTIAGAARPSQSVIIEAGKIVRVEKIRKGRLPKGPAVVDGRGKFVIPGLWDMHVHWYDERYLPLFLANGVTGVRQMSGFPVHHKWRQRADRGTLVAPRSLIASTIVDGPKPVWPGSISVANAAEARAAVTRAKTAGADFVKIYNGIPREAFRGIVEQSRNESIPFAGHTPYAVSLSEASDAGMRSLEHLRGVALACSFEEETLRKSIVSGQVQPRQGETRAVETYDPAKAVDLFRRLARNKTWQVPTLTVLKATSYLDDANFRNDQRLRYMPRSLAESWQPDKDRFSQSLTPVDWADAKRRFEFEKRIVGEMHRAGVRILAGTDVLNPYCFPGFSIHDELKLLVEAGLTPLAALQAATSRAAEFQGSNSFGSVTAGNLADLVILDANPLVDIGATRRIAGVVFGGRYFNRASLDAMLAAAAKLSAAKSIVEPLYLIAERSGIDAAISTYRRIRKQEAEEYDLGEDALIDLGYRLLGAKKLGEAKRIFELEVEMYPSYWNAHDSLGEAYEAEGDRARAVAAYKHSLELEPANEGAVEKLKRLLQ